MRLGDSLIRLFGADPDVFRPVYRAQTLILKRRARVVQRQRRGFWGTVSPFTLLCFFSGLYGLFFITLVVVAKSPLIGSGLALTLGMCFLFLVVATDNFDVLVNPRETLLLAAHPYDSRSFLLAKLAALGRSIGILTALLFGPSAVALSWAVSPLAGPAFFAGAAAASVATVTGGILIAAAIVRLKGRSAMEGMMPWMQGIFQVIYFIAIGGSGFVRLLNGTPEAVSALLWAVPSFWFLAPLELTLRGPEAAPLGRLALMAATLLLLLRVTIRWLGAGLRERLLEPEETRPRAVTRRRAAYGGGSERSRLFALLRIQLRSDWRTRSEFLLMPMMGIFFLLFYSTKRGNAALSMGVSTVFYVWLLIVSADVLTRSARPQTLWCLLTAPVDRTRLSLETIGMVRLFQLLPLLATSAAVQLWQAGVSLTSLAVLLQLLVLGDFVVIVGKAMFPEFPFSQPRIEGAVGGSRIALMLLGGLISGVTTGLLYVSRLFGNAGILATIAVLVLLRFPAWRVARRRAAAAAAHLELAAAATA
ncbi:MAG TPA: hypothetical protein VMW27_12910 [Thermoanaerobaculia bacterium]|nr:hypothetical protein [Thermoanaerobaculia bacterium]